MNRDNRRLRLIFALLVVTSLTLLTADLRGGKGGAFGAVRNALGSVFAPVQRGLSSAFRPISDAVSSALHSGRDQRRIDDLQRQVIELHRQIDNDAELKRDTPTLQRLGQLAYLSDTTGVPARVIGHGSALDDFEQTELLNRGSADGVILGSPVVDVNGLVGKIVRTTARTSTIELIDDPHSSVSITDATGTIVGQADGQGPNQPLAYTQIVPAGQPPLGTPLYTSQDSAYDHGIPVGTVGPTHAQAGGTEQAGLITPYAHIDSAGLVLVLLSQARSHTSPVLVPQSPVPSASPSASGAPAPAPGTSASGAPLSAGPSAGASAGASAGPSARPSARPSASGTTTP